MLCCFSKKLKQDCLGETKMTNEFSHMGENICDWCGKELIERADYSSRSLVYSCENPKCSGPLFSADQALSYMKSNLGKDWFCQFDSRQTPPYRLGKFEYKEEKFTGKSEVYLGNSWKDCFDKALKK